ncbi:hydroperoxide isomerase ALOXE3-like [Xiphophorus maculatus]|uniref:hydroperoxide isomerase ALOXE3-like n=1 Tax=Xiphophorus maculatus TaxID=8083 RepID=UPI0003B5C510|nr:hydroperoxide isomerase ALOXE3-like [Xiphophorus maculatus]XP_023203293.1 hydroperoxide isomerase ALOXE3-like [Xiphophorus maculatus]
MAEYKLKVTTGAMKHAGTMDHIYVILLGTEGQSPRTELNNLGIDFIAGKTRAYKVKTSSSLGKLLLVKVEKDPFLLFPEDEWYCSKIEVTTPEDEEIVFPCYRWISRGEFVELRGGKGVTFMEEQHPLLLNHRKKELEYKKSSYQWAFIDDGLLHVSHFKDVFELLAEVRFSMSELEHTHKIITLGLEMEGLAEPGKWKRIEDIKNIFQYKKTNMSEYVSEHWKEDDFFGFQFLNGTNPNVIKCCSKLPPNFPVTDEMVRPFLETGTTLEKEMEEGNIFLCDQKIMDGIPTRQKDGNHLYVAAGLCLFYKNPEGKLLPIAIQLYQQPSEQNPIFLPSDLETDWLLAKLFFRSSDLIQHQTLYHLMHTHYLAEVFTVATFRCLPTIHPLYKLLIPHFRYTLHVNILVRKLLLSPGGALSESSLGVEGLTELMRRDLSQMTYSSLCLPENITERGLELIPNFYYRDDALKLWNYLNGFAKAMVEYYYSSDSDVIKDIELQEWINEIFTHGFLENKHSGFPSCFNTIEEVAKFITMVIFRVSAQHAAVNNGQYDYNSWVPNGSLLLCKPPPATKGQSSMQTVLETLPDVEDSVKIMSAARILSEKYTDVVLLGEFPEEHFDEPRPKEIIKALQVDLYYLREEIAARNSQLEIPYTYLNPDVVENSVTI